MLEIYFDADITHHNFHPYQSLNMSYTYMLMYEHKKGQPSYITQRKRAAEPAASTCAPNVMPGFDDFADEMTEKHHC